MNAFLYFLTSDPFSCGSARTTLKDAEISLIDYAIATDAYDYQEVYLGVSNKTHARIEIIP